ncbi:MAG: hypothetical protein LBL59_06685 [Xanthomonadaceae bacterium]|jgi:hypothetical protein|nr:hypothetical protein [Xanthomonadaceae bacterium]
MLPSSPGLWLLPLLLLGACAHQPTASVAKEPPATTEPASLPQGDIVAPRYSAEEISIRILRLIDSVRHTSELTPERVRGMTGVTLNSHSHGGGDMEGEIANGWRYGISVSNWSDIGPQFAFRFVKREDTAASIESVCGFNLTHYIAYLEGRGFTGELHRGGPGATYWRFHRGQVPIRLYFSGPCVNMVLVNSPVENPRRLRRRRNDN